MKNNLRKAALYEMIVLEIYALGIAAAYMHNSATGMISPRTDGAQLFYYTFMWGNRLLNVLFPLTPVIWVIFCDAQKPFAQAGIATGLSMILPVTCFVVSLLLGGWEGAIFRSYGTYSKITGENNYLPALAFLLNTALIAYGYALLAALLKRRKSPLCLILPIMLYNAAIFCPFEALLCILPQYSYDIVSLIRSPILHIIGIMLAFIVSLALMLPMRYNGEKDVKGT